MMQENIARSVTGTLLVVGLMAGTAGTINPNNTTVISNSQYETNGYYINNDYQNYNAAMNMNDNKQFENIKQNRLMDDASSLFGDMRDATYEEMKSTSDYIKKISKPTGVNFFDLC